MAGKKMNLSSKRLAIDKSNATMVVQISIAAFISVFCLVSIHSLLSQRAYQAEVESKKQVALQQLQSNIESADQLIAAYTEFAESPQNVLGGNPSGNGDRDGDNPRIVLDALPSVYDFPALATSIEKMLNDNNIIIDNISGTDEELSQSGAQTDSETESDLDAELDSETSLGVESSGSPQAVEMPFVVEASTSESGARSFLSLFERSIRPIQIQKISIDGEDSQLKFTVEAKSYYQPEKGLKIGEETIR